MLSLLALPLLASCEKKFDPASWENNLEEGNSTSDEFIPQDTLVWQDGKSEMWLSGQEFTGIVLGEMEDPANLLSDECRVPTLDEGRYLHTITLQGLHSNERYLCYDEDTEIWYSFLFDNQGTIAKAGRKTKYTLRGVRTVKNGNVTDGSDILFNLIELPDNWYDNLEVEL